ncbi:hypothetical protein N2152v2_010081 [Parachlorella kessleri]
MPKSVCISVDSSPGDKVHLVTVIEPSIQSELQSGVDRMRGLAPGRVHCEADPVLLEKTQQFLARCKEDLAKKGVDSSSISTAPLVACIGNSHDIGRQIVDYTEEAKCESVVMGSRGLGLGKRALLGVFGLGSVSEYVVKHAGCNVIVHKSPLAAQTTAK